VKGKVIGLIIMASSFSFFAFYVASLYLWARYTLKEGRYLWTWWIIVLPTAAIILLVLLFVMWVGWVMVKPKPKSLEEFIKSKEQSRKT